MGLAPALLCDPDESSSVWRREPEVTVVQHFDHSPSTTTYRSSWRASQSV